MSKRILNWYLPEVVGDGTNQGVSYCLEQSYALPAVVRIRAHSVPRGEDLKVDIRADGESIFGTHTVTTILPRSEYSIIDYRFSTLATSTFSVGEIVDGGTSTAQAEIMLIDHARLSVRMIKETAFTVDEEITGATNSATADVDAFVWNKTTPLWTHTETPYYAVLPKDESSETHAQSFANDKTDLKQYSWITLDVVQSGGAKQISVQLELDTEFTEELPSEED